MGRGEREVIDMSKRYQLTVLYRADGEQTFSFSTKRERDDHRTNLESFFGTRIIKIEEWEK